MFEKRVGGIVIKKMQERDLHAIMRIWLESNLEAHDFVDESYWKGNFDAVKEAISAAEVYVYVDDADNADDEPRGFIGLMDDYIAGLFVDGRFRSQGIGKLLLDHAKSVKSRLSLNVYRKNERAMAFYRREGFRIQAEGRDESTGEEELTMMWVG